MKLPDPPWVGALYALHLGYPISPLQPGSKEPYPKTRGFKDATTDWDLIQAWHRRYPGCNWGIWCTGLVVADLDPKGGGQTAWAELTDPATGNDPLDPPGVWTGDWEGQRGLHLYYRAPDGQQLKSSRGDHGGVAPGIDTRGFDGYVVCPGSLHPSGVYYEGTLRAPEDLPQVPGWLVARLRSPGPGRPARARGETSGGGLAALLALPPGHPGRGNDWLTAVAGHYAKALPYKDGYTEACRTANQVSADPIGEADFTKTVKSVWRTEQARRAQQWQPETGWLKPGDDGHSIWTQTRHGKGRDAVYGSAEWADFDLRVDGIAEDETGKRSWIGRLLRKRDHTERPVILEDAVLADQRALTRWLAGHGVTIIPPDEVWPKTGTQSTRLARYLESQGADRARVTDHLGWHDGVGFLTFDGVIAPDGLQPLNGIRPAAHLSSWSDHHYGFDGDERRALELMRHVMEFQKPEYTAVFTAWLTALVLKGQYQIELFPIFSIESRAESGKSIGFFELMVQLFGNRYGSGQATYADTRDRLSAHNNGVVWIDDAARLDYIADLIRQMTVGGKVSKKAQDRRTSESVQLRSGLFISGEGLGTMTSEPAIQDRFVRIVGMDSPKGRESLRQPGVPQIVEIDRIKQEANGDLTRYAGWVTRAVLRRADQLGSIRALSTEPGRIGAVNGLLRTCARVFGDAIGDRQYVPWVDQYCTGRSSAEILPFTLAEVVPYLLRLHNLPGGAEARLMGYPAWVDEDGRVQVSPGKAADVWRERRSLSDRERQLGSAQAIGMDLTAAEADPLRNVRVAQSPAQGSGTAGFRKYRRLSADHSRAVLNLAEAANEGYSEDVLEGL